MFRFFRRSSSSNAIALLHGKIMARSRQPEFYTDLGVADTLQGRFEMVTLHAALVVTKLNGSGPPGPEIAGDLTDAIFSHFEIALRETGVSDIAVPKRMKKLAQSYLGRGKAYAEALAMPGLEPLQEALARNIYGSDSTAPPVEAVRLARYVRALANVVNAATLQELLDGTIDWPDAANYR